MSKKKLFKKWHEGYGKFIFQNFIVDEKAYHKIKEIFSSVYDMSMNSMNEKIKLIQNEIKTKVHFMKNEYKALKRTYDYLEHKKKMLSAEMKELYDAFDEKFARNDFVESTVKNHYGLEYMELESNIAKTKKMMSRLKNEIKMIEGLLMPRKS